MDTERSTIGFRVKVVLHFDLFFLVWVVVVVAAAERFEGVDKTNEVEKFETPTSPGLGEVIF